jgi:hypothetical protein
MRLEYIPDRIGPVVSLYDQKEKHCSEENTHMSAAIMGHLISPTGRLSGKRLKFFIFYYVFLGAKSY